MFYIQNTPHSMYFGGQVYNLVEYGEFFER